MTRIGNKAGIQNESGFITMQAIDRLERTSNDLQTIQSQIIGETAGLIQASATPVALSIGTWVEQMELFITKARGASPVFLWANIELSPGELASSADTAEFLFRFRRDLETDAIFEQGRLQAQSDPSGVIPRTVLAQYQVIDFGALAGNIRYFLDVQWASNTGAGPTTDPAVEAARVQILEIL